MEVLLLLVLNIVGLNFVSSVPTTWDINAPGCGGNLVGYKYPDHYIVGGAEAVPHAYPWMAAFYYRGSLRCGGSYIKGSNGHSYILTAAHCTQGTNTNSVEVRLGRHDLAADEPSAQHIGVAQIINHGSYNAGNLNWDVALMRLASNPTDNQYVAPGCIPINDKTKNETAFVSGWGSLSEGGSYPDTLRVVYKPILPHTVCRDQLGSNNYFEDNMLCSGYEDGGADSCQGDSGGPLMSQRGSRVEIAGVVSWGYGCANPQSPGVYHNTFKSKSWIDGIINNPV